MLGFFNDWKIIQFTNKTTTNEDFDAVHKFLLDGISYYIYALVKNGKYSAINIAYPTTVVYYVVGFLSEPCTLQYDRTFYKQVIKLGELIVKAVYINIIKTMPILPFSIHGYG